MATIIYDEPWSPSDINCNWKPEKLSRYSFVTNLIDFGASGVKLGYEQNSNNEVTNSAMNLTDYILVNANHTYYFTCEKNLTRGIRYIAFFTSGKTFLSSRTFNPGVASSLNGNFYTPANCAYVKITFYKEAWERCSLRASYSNSLVSNEKDMTPLDIVDNKEGEQIYQDLHFEVYVKAEAIIKNFVDVFNLKELQAFPSVSNSYYSSYIQNNLLFNCNTKDYYGKNYSFSSYQANYSYVKGDLIEVVDFGRSYKWICLKNHISASTFYEDLFGTDSVSYTGNWGSVEPNGNTWLSVDKSIKESNYSLKENFPYVGSLVFTNLWGCDLLNYLRTYTNEAYLAISYGNILAKNLMSSDYHYDKFFQQGYFLDKNPFNNSSLEGFGVRLICGEEFKEDPILGSAYLNNYCEFSENRHAIPSDYDPYVDSINNEYFDRNIYKAFDHWYKFSPKKSIPFFKEKVFNDFYIELVLQREDKLGNIYQRVVDLPILVTFVNNLIKIYFRNSDLDGTPYYTEEYLNSNVEHSYTYSGDGSVISSSVIWCPNVKNLSLSSTILDPSKIESSPKLVDMNGGSNLSGQLCKLTWTAQSLGGVGSKITAIHSLEYSDGENYDKFIYIENIERTA